MIVHRIDGPPGPRRVEGQAPARSVRSADLGDGAATDRVEVSAEARRIRDLAEAAAALPGVREHKVEPLRRSIDDDTYRVDPRAVARAILEHEDGLAR
jgi:flagellar biosynthesis anti-sigma factor FlgM